LASGRSAGENDADADSEGYAGRRLAQGESLATLADPLVQRQGTGGATSDREPRQADGRRRPRAVEHADLQMEGCQCDQAAEGVPTAAFEAGLHPTTEAVGAPACPEA